jgi:DNA-binding MarR family transcriptional regulator
MQTQLKHSQSSPPEKNREQCASAIMETIPLVGRFVGTEMRRNGEFPISMPQLRVLWFISVHPGCSLSSAADDLTVTKAAASDLVDRLVKKGFVSRVEDPQERRKVLLTLTEDGTKLLQQSRKRAQAAVSKMLGQIGSDDLKKIVAGLEVLKMAFQEV